MFSGMGILLGACTITSVQAQLEQMRTKTLCQYTPYMLYTLFCPIYVHVSSIFICKNISLAIQKVVYNFGNNAIKPCCSTTYLCISCHTSSLSVHVLPYFACICACSAILRHYLCIFCHTSPLSVHILPYFATICAYSAKPRHYRCMFCHTSPVSVHVLPYFTTICAYSAKLHHNLCIFRHTSPPSVNTLPNFLTIYECVHVLTYYSTISAYSDKLIYYLCIFCRTIQLFCHASPMPHIQYSAMVFHFFGICLKSPLFVPILPKFST